MTIRLATLNDIPQIIQLITAVLPGMIASGNLQWDNNYPTPEFLLMTLSLASFG